MSNSRIKLSEKQEQIASHKNGALLVLASAGSGKTRVLTERIKRLVEITQRKVLAITFTNKASEEIKERLQADVDVNEKLFVGTFHAFCIYVLENHGSTMGYNEIPQIFSNTDDRLKVIEAAILSTPSVKSDYENSEIKRRNIIKGNVLEAIARIKREVILEEEFEEKGLDSTTILLFRAYQELMSSLNAIDFDDLLLITYKLLMYNPKIASLYRRDFEFICVDEAQDMNKAQYMVLKALVGDENQNIMLVGDPKQAIYGFNGSDSKFMEKLFKSDFNPIEVTLNENYRSSKKILELANKIIPDPSSIENVVIDGKCEIVGFDSVDDEANWVVSKISELLSLTTIVDIEGDIDCDRIAILARNKYVLSPIEEKLKAAGYNTYYKSSSSEVIFDSDTMKFFSLALQVKINPKDRLHLSQLLRVANKKGMKTLHELHDDLLPKSILSDMLSIILELDNDGRLFKSKINSLLAKVKLADNYSNMDENERVLLCSDLVELLKHWHKYETKTSTLSIASFRNAMALGQTYQGVENHGIALSTVHTMKGQENDIVFLVGLDDATFPDYRAIEKGDNSTEMQQEKNNLYVAITRSKRFLYITYPTSRIMPWGDVRNREVSRFIKNLIE